MQELATSHGDYALTPIGIEFYGELDQATWIELGQRLGAAGRSLGFLVGDWLNYGEAKVKYGEYSHEEGGIYHEAIKITGLDYNTLSTYAGVARKVHFSMRIENLSFEHHRKVAPLKTDEEKQKWLQIAEQEREKNGKTMSSRRLARSILKGEVVDVSELSTPENDRGQNNIYPYINGLVTFWSKLKKAGWHETTEPERIRIMISDLQRVIDVYEELNAIYKEREAEQPEVPEWQRG